jgi:hypothetical protein
LEQVDYIIDKSNVGMISDAVLAFAIASQSHRSHLQMIFAKI